MEIIDIMKKAAFESGKILMEKLGNVKYSTKISYSDVVSEADLKSQEKIVEIIKSQIPNARFFLEESDINDISDFKSSENLFVVDPLDGTLNYVHNLGFFCVSIARVEYGEIKEGVVYSPILDQMFYAIRGEGAFLNEERIFVKDKKELKKSLFVTGWPYEEKLMNKAIKSMEKMLSKVQEVRVLGSAALELSYVASGRLDGYWEFGLYPWDVAAGIIILEEAGGKLTGIYTENPLFEGNIIATVPSIFEETISILKNFKA